MSIDTKIFDKLLTSGEQLEWVSKPEPFNIMEGALKKKLVTKWISCAIAAIVLSVAYVLAISEVMPVILIAIIGTCAIIALRPMMDAKSAQSKLIFAISNKRVFVYKSEIDVSTMSIDKIPLVKIYKKANGAYDVAFGTAASAPAHKLLSLAVISKPDGSGKKGAAAGMAFFNIAEADKVRALLHEDTKVIKERS